MMDTSEQYVKMCEKAGEIQLEKYEIGFISGDFIFNGKSTQTIGNDWLFIGKHFTTNRTPYFDFAIMEKIEPKIYYEQEYPVGEITCKRETFIIQTLGGIGLWLPRLDQLQEMIDDEYQKIAKFWRFVDFLKKPYDSRSHQNTWIVWTNMGSENSGSMEQLWLAFVMKERYSKFWNGEDWVEEGK